MWSRDSMALAAHGLPASSPLARSTQSTESQRLWERHEVAYRVGTRKRFVSALVGEITLDCQKLAGKSPTEQLVVFTARPGSEDAERLRLLAVIGHQGFPDNTRVGLA
jgi:hypothetical protein